jgi:hypothetical protein
VAAAAPGLNGHHDPAVKVQYSKRLPQCDEELSRIDARHRIQIASDVHTNRSDGSWVAEAKTNGIRIAEIEELV